MPKLCRAPIPMLRITAPQMTAMQKLCCGDSAVASDRSMKRPVFVDFRPRLAAAIGVFRCAIKRICADIRVYAHKSRRERWSQRDAVDRRTSVRYYELHAISER